MELTREHKKTLASLLWAEKGGVRLQKGERFYLVFAEEVPECHELVENGYLRARENPTGQGSKLAYALTEKGRMVAKKIPISTDLQKSEPKWRKRQLP
jgi:hypothetical protein